MTTEREAELPELPTPMKAFTMCEQFGPHAAVFSFEDMRSYALSAADQREKKVREELDRKLEHLDTSIDVLTKVQQRREGRTAWLLLSDMTDAQRLEVFGRFCKHCGSKDPDCKCWNDE